MPAPGGRITISDRLREARRQLRRVEPTELAAAIGFGSATDLAAGLTVRREPWVP